MDTQLQHTNTQLLDFLNSITVTVRERKHLISGREGNTGKHLSRLELNTFYAFYNYVSTPPSQQ